MSFSDYQIFQELIKGKEEDSFFKNSVSQMLRIVMEEGCSTQKQVLNYLGERFRVKLSLPDWYPNEEAAKFLFRYVCFGLGRERGKDGFMPRKWAWVACCGPSQEGSFASLFSMLISSLPQCPSKTVNAGGHQCWHFVGYGDHFVSA